MPQVPLYSALLTILGASIVSVTLAQVKPVTCAHNSYRDQLIREGVLSANWEVDTIEQAPDAKTQATVLQIPVVFHLMVLPTDSFPGVKTNPSDDAVYSQLAVLNEDFRRKAGTRGFNTNPVGADTEIEFCLANIDPSGVSRLGILRHPYADTYTFSQQDDVAMKGSLAWDPDRYLNIYVVASIDNGNALGYSFGPQGGFAGNARDGVVLAQYALGSKEKSAPLSTFLLSEYNLGRSLTHEVGHYLNLLHTWDRTNPNSACTNGDKVNDTPICDLPFYSGLNGLCTKPVQCGNVRMTENYMDYSSDRCMNVFTVGQTTRMRNAITTYRSTLVDPANLLSTGCIVPKVGTDDLARLPLRISAYPNPSAGSVYTETPSESATLSVYDGSGRLVLTQEIRKTSVIDLTANAPGLYRVVVISSSGQRGSLTLMKQ